jgi:hypothetical protein
LKEIKIIDPAVGSGAFPVGILQEMTEIRYICQNKISKKPKSTYEIKKEILENNSEYYVHWVLCKKAKEYFSDVMHSDKDDSINISLGNIQHYGNLKTVNWKDFLQKSSKYIPEYAFNKYLIKEKLLRRILFLSHSIDHSLSMDEYRYTTRYLVSQGYRDAMEEAGLESNIVECYYNSPENIIIDKIEEHDAILGMNDYYIMQNIKLIRESNLKRLEKIFLVGYNNTPWSNGEIPFSSVSIRENSLVEAIV